MNKDFKVHITYDGFIKFYHFFSQVFSETKDTRIAGNSRVNRKLDRI